LHLFGHRKTPYVDDEEFSDDNYVVHYITKALSHGE